MNRDWQKELRELWLNAVHAHKIGQVKHPADFVWPFIDTLLKSQKQELNEGFRAGLAELKHRLVKKIKSMRVECDTNDNAQEYGEDVGYNEALEDLIKELEG